MLNRWRSDNVLYFNQVASALLAISYLVYAGLPCWAHNGGILVQAQAGQLVTGLDDASAATQTIGDRAFSLLLPSSLANDVPAFQSFTNPPEGAEGLPVGSELYWDFLPMIDGDSTSNLLYWDGNATSLDAVSFGAIPPADVTLTLYTQFFADSAVVDGSGDVVPGKLIGTITGSATSLHAHRWFFIDAPGGVPEGVYLAALRVRMEGYLHSNPFYVVAATDGISASTLDDLARVWVDEHVDRLILPGDFQFDGDVDGSDFLTWQATPRVGELAVWETKYGPTASTAQLASVPEPASVVLVATAVVLLTCRTRAAAAAR